MNMTHRKTGKTYRVLMLAVREADLEPVVVYTGEEGTIWVRPASEFFDGRFCVNLPGQAAGVVQ